MLPNWLYGKSKSKLASILGGGGGTPADYNQVKAQVAQNTEDITLLDTSSQALTAQANSMTNVLGAKNLLPNNGLSKTVNGITFTVNLDGSVNVDGTNAVSGNTWFWLTNVVTGNQDQFLLKSGKYILSSELAMNECRLNVISGSDYLAQTNINRSEVSFELAQDTYVRVGISVTSEATVSNKVVKPMIRPASITDDTYVPYSMTNQELTEKLTADANLGTAVDLSTYSTYSNMYTAPSDGYVHFQSATSGSQQRTIYTYGNNTTAATDPHFTHSTSANNKAFEIYIRKGLKIYVDGLSSGDTISFYPLT